MREGRRDWAWLTVTLVASDLGAVLLAFWLAAVLVWRNPARSGDVLRLMIFLNALWTLADLVYIPLMHLSALDFYVKAVVNAALAIGLAVAGRRAGIV